MGHYLGPQVVVEPLGFAGCAGSTLKSLNPLAPKNMHVDGGCLPLLPVERMLRPEPRLPTAATVWRPRVSRPLQ